MMKSYDRLDTGLMRFVKHLCTDSIVLMRPTAVGDHTGEQYSTRGRTYIIIML